MSQFIDNIEDLTQLCEQLSQSSFVAVDTEFVRERTYYPQLALIQLGNETITACIDPLEINDLTPIKTLFANRAVTKVFHAASQDLEIFYHLFGELPTPIYDSQIAATLQGLGDQIGYAMLVSKMLGVELDKSHSRTDWLLRPLSEKQISYAEDDVRYLSKLYPIQRKVLEEQARFEWLEDDFAAISSPERYRPNPEGIWQRVKGINKLRGLQLAIIERLAAWRERLAMRQDVPRKRIVSDDILLDIARLRPKSLNALGKLRGINEGMVNKHGEKLLQLVQEAESLPKSEWPKLNRPQRLSSEQEPIVDALQAIIKLAAHQHKINAATLTSRKELEALVRGERELSILQGWRRHHGGELLLNFLNGNSNLQMGSNKLELTTSSSD